MGDLSNTAGLRLVASGPAIIPRPAPVSGRAGGDEFGLEYGGAPQPWDIDPSRYPSEMMLAPRVYGRTQSHLQTLCMAEGLTFWGNAAALLFEAFARGNAVADLSSFDRCPADLINPAPKLAKAGRPRPQAVLVPLSPLAMEWVVTSARAAGFPPKVFAGLVLFRNAAHAIATVQWQRRLGLI